jgi:hypothetical protein
MNKTAFEAFFVAFTAAYLSYHPAFAENLSTYLQVFLVRRMKYTYFF